MSEGSIDPNANTTWRDRISIDPQVCHGKPCIRGTRIFISLVLDNLAAGHSVEDVIASYPGLAREDVRAALAYAAELAHERTVYTDKTA